MSNQYKKQEDRLIQSQPERLTYYNLSAIAALCVQPRICFDDQTGVTDVWASNMIVEKNVGDIFWEASQGSKKYILDEVDFTPVIYFVSDKERVSVKGLSETENKYIMSAMLITYKVRKFEDEEDLVGKRIDYTAVLEQSLDGYVVPLEEILCMLFYSAVNFNRQIPHVPHKELRYNFIIPETIREETDRSFSKRGLSNPFQDKSLFLQFIEHRYKEDMEDIKNKINEDTLEIKFVNDTTLLKMNRNMTLPYLEVTEAYRTSFGIHPFYDASIA